METCLLIRVTSGVTVVENLSGSLLALAVLADLAPNAE